MFERFRNKPLESPETENAREDFERYKKWLHLNEEDLPGKTILDVGSANAQFGEYVEKKFPGTTVIRFDYLIRAEPSERVRIDFRARADQLPLRRDSVDIALAHASISNNSGEEMLAALQEIFATVKAGGEIRIAPILEAPFGFSENRLRLVREYVDSLEKEGVATAEWVNNGTSERTTPMGEKIQETRYCLIIRKSESSAPS
jgi:SAM-dependent methyltransferase